MVQRQLENMISETNSVKKRIASVLNGLDFEVASKKNIETRLNALRSSVEKQASRGVKYKNAYTKVTETVVNTDGKFGDQSHSITDQIKRFSEGGIGSIVSFITKNKLGKYAAVAGLFLSANSATKEISTLWKIAKKAGYLGEFLSLAECVVKGGAENVAKGIKAFYKFGSGLISKAKQAGNTKQKWKEYIFGLGDYVTDKLKVGAEAGKKSLSQIWAASNKITKDTWIGLVFDGAINAVKNYKEFGGFTTRAVAETMVETAWDTFFVTATGAVIAAGLTAVTGGAPIIAVAAGTVIVSSVADTIANWATNTDGGLTEVVSDTLIDFAEKVGDCIPKVPGFLKSCWKNCLTMA